MDSSSSTVSTHRKIMNFAGVYSLNTLVENQATASQKLRSYPYQIFISHKDKKNNKDLLNPELFSKTLRLDDLLYLPVPRNIIVAFKTLDSLNKFTEYILKNNIDFIAIRHTNK